MWFQLLSLGPMKTSSVTLWFSRQLRVQKGQEIKFSHTEWGGGGEGGWVCVSFLCLLVQTKPTLFC